MTVPKLLTHCFSAGVLKQ